MCIRDRSTGHKQQQTTATTNNTHKRPLFTLRSTLYSKPPQKKHDIYLSATTDDISFFDGTALSQMEPSSVIYLPNILPSDINNLIVFALIALLVLWSIRIFRNSCQLLELSRSIALQAIFRLDIPNESTLSPREYFEQLLRRRQQAKSPPSSVQYVLNPVNIDKSSIQLLPATTSTSEKLAEEAVGRYSLKFVFDALYPCNIRLYWGVPKSDLDRKLFGEALNKKTKKKKSKRSEDGEESEEGEEAGEGDAEGEEAEGARKEEEQNEEEEAGLLKEKGKKKKPVWIEMLSAPFSSLMHSTEEDGDPSTKEGDDDIEANNVSSLPRNRLSSSSSIEVHKSTVVNSCYFSSPILNFDSGMKQSFEAPINAQLVVNSTDEQEFSFSYDAATSERYPLLIELTLANNASQYQQSSSIRVIPSQFTIVQFTKVTDDPETYRASVVNQFFDDANNNSSSSSTCNEDEKGNATRTSMFTEYKDVYGIYDSEPDCVVCLCEPKAATILPCRHFCVCFSCMLKLDKCPVCRTKIKSYMRFYRSDEAEQQQQQQSLLASSSSTSSRHYDNKDL
eukprot:TRINITY_DN9796_c0_g1_i1.p1 TRINITY_DN9796_c0_g1~~TRINITY_DN9796_c0_g1_i1.p1  ORF type:complete len:564 (+),score=142.18 TRINITY_DN9796_c0_g1_i1:40-1731(+)